MAGLAALGALPPVALAGLPPAARVALVVLAGAGAVPMAAGKWSPDIDQFKIWNRIDRMVPDEWLGFGGPMKHRGITHWWLWPALATAGLWWACRHVPLPVAVVLVALAWVPLAGVWSHLIADFCVGAGYCGGKRAEADDPTGDWRRKSALDGDDAPRGPGIPLAPWGLHVGLGVKCGTAGELLFVIASLLAGMFAVLGAYKGVVVALPGPAWAGLALLVLATGIPARLKWRRNLDRARKQQRAGVAR